MYNLLLNAIYIIAKKFHITIKMNLYQILKQSFFEWNVGGIKRETGMLVRGMESKYKTPTSKFVHAVQTMANISFPFSIHREAVIH